MLAAARIGAVVVPFTTFATARELRRAAGRRRRLDPAGRAGVPLPRLRPARCPRCSASRSSTCRSACSAPPHRNCGTSCSIRPTSAALADAVDDELLRALEDDVDGSDPLTIVYTSGSTGTPKGAVHTHASLLTHQRNLNAIRGLSADDRLFCNSPFFWVGGFAFGLLATTGRRMPRWCARTPSTPAETLDLLEAERPTDHQRVRRGDRAPRPARQLRRPRPVVDAARQPLPDHGSRRATRRSRTAPQHARHDRGGQHASDQCGRIAINPSTVAVRTAGPHQVSRPDRRPRHRAARRPGRRRANSASAARI